MFEKKGSLFMLCIFFVFLLFRVVDSRIELGSRISVEENNYWVSSNGDFAVGFFNRSGKHSVGVRFSSRSIPFNKQIVVWVAGADLTVGDNSYFELNRNGELVLFDSAVGAIAWESKTANLFVASAVLSDNGNLVLLNGHGHISWQSFDTPSDTLLPGQNLSSSQTLRAASRNYVSSYYTLRVDSLGLQLKWENNVVYWTSGSHSQSILRALLSSDGTLQLLDQRSRSIWSAFGEDHNESDVKFRIFRLDVDGNLRLYSWIEASKSWRIVWQAIGNQCNVFATCGLNGLCIFNSSGSAVCKCPFMLTSDSNAKCLVPYGQNCRSGSSMVTYERTFLYGIYPPNETIVHASSLQCKILCQKDPLCTAATFTNDGSGQCRMKQTQYISGHSQPSVSSISFVKRCSDPLAVPIIPKSPPSVVQHSLPKQSRKISISCLIGATAGAFATFFVLQLGICLFFLFKRSSFRREADSSYAGPYPKSFTILSCSEIKELTENFKFEIRPKTFKGMLSNKQLVIVKALNATLDERKFRSAATKLGIICHKNLVKLEGYCCESTLRYLVYEFSKNGTLYNSLEDPKMCTRLTWQKRMGICLSVARAIFYLHAGCREFVGHGNLRLETVVIDDSLEAKVAEFGLGSVESWGHVGCAETDVKDFGKMVIELISGEVQNLDDMKLAYESWSRSQSTRVVDKNIKGVVDPNELERALRLAFWCLQVDERMRPSMGEVVKVLEGVLSVDPPPPPFAHRSSSAEEELPESDQEP